jgi:hypothetical protein
LSPVPFFGLAVDEGTLRRSTFLNGVSSSKTWLQIENPLSEAVRREREEEWS